MNFLYLLGNLRTPALNVFFSLITYLGHELFVIGVVCVQLWCADKNFAYRLGLVFFLSGLSVQTLKLAFHVPRPWVIDPNFQPVESAVPAATGYSFPSGHTQGATALFASLALRFKKNWIRLACVLLFLLVGFARMYLGVHTPTDVLVGMALALAAVAVVAPLARMLERERTHDGAVALVLAGFSAAVMIFSLVMFGSGVVREYKMAADACKSAASGLAFAAGWYVERKYIRFDTRCDRGWKQLVKCAIGLSGALFFKESVKLLFGVSLATDIIRYLLTVFWVVAVFPWLWGKLPFFQNGASR